MYEEGISPECSVLIRVLSVACRDVQTGRTAQRPVHISLVMGVASGMPAKASWLPLLLEELPEGAHWQAIAIGRQEVWEVHRKTAELGGHLRTSVEHTFLFTQWRRPPATAELIENLRGSCPRVWARDCKPSRGPCGFCRSRVGSEECPLLSLSTTSRATGGVVPRDTWKVTSGVRTIPSAVAPLLVKGHDSHSTVRSNT